MKRKNIESKETVSHIIVEPLEATKKIKPKKSTTLPIPNATKKTVLDTNTADLKRKNSDKNRETEYENLTKITILQKEEEKTDASQSVRKEKFKKNLFLKIPINDGSHRTFDFAPVYSDIQQGSEEWKKRRKIIGSSDVGSILEQTIGRVHHYYEFICSGIKKDPNEAMKHGTATEPVNLEYFCKVTGLKVGNGGHYRCGKNSKYREYMADSPDGLVYKKKDDMTKQRPRGLLEIKSPVYGPTRVIYQAHISQCMYHAGFTGADIVYYIARYVKNSETCKSRDIDEKDDEGLIMKIHYSDQYFRFIMKYVDIFINCLTTKTKPDYSSKVDPVPGISVQFFDFDKKKFGPIVHDFRGKATM